MAKIAGGVLLAQAPAALLGMAQAAAADEQATQRLAQALQNLGGDVAGNTAKVNERIAAGQKLAFSDDDIRDSFQKLAAATGDTDEALKRQSVAMDFARGAGIPLSQATTLLGKVTAENVEVFKRMGITIGEGASEAEALAVIQAKFAGQAETYASSTAGQFEVMQIKMDEAKETIGAAMLPAMIAIGNVLSQQVIPAVEAFAAAVGPSLKAAFGWMADNKDIVVAALSAVAVVITTALIPATIAWIAVETAKIAVLIASAAAFIAANAPLLVIGVAIAALVAGIVLLVANWDTIVEKVPALGVAFDAVKAAAEAFAGWITSDFVPAISAIGEASVDVGKAVVDAFNAAWKQIEPIVKPVIDQVVAYIRFIADVVQEVFSLVINLIQGDWAGAWDDAKDILGAFKTFGEETLNNLLAFLKGLGSLFWEAAKNVGQMVFDGIKAGLGNLYDMFRGVMQDAIDGLQSMAGSLVQKAKDIAGQIASALNPKNWVGSPKGVQNWYPYYLDWGLRNMADAAARSPYPQMAASSIAAGLNAPAVAMVMPARSLAAQGQVDAEGNVYGGVWNTGGGPQFESWEQQQKWFNQGALGSNGTAYNKSLAAQYGGGGGGGGIRIESIQINLGAGAGRQQGEDAANGLLGVLRARGVMT